MCNVQCAAHSGPAKRRRFSDQVLACGPTQNSAHFFFFAIDPDDPLDIRYYYCTYSYFKAFFDLTAYSLQLTAYSLQWYTPYTVYCEVYYR
jgi:hypothetical protein